MNKKTILKQNRAASLLSYGLLLGLIGITAITAITGLGKNVSELFGNTSNTLDTAALGNTAPTGSSPTPNQAPTFSGSTPSIPPLTINVAMVDFDIIGFNDAEGDSLTFSQIGTWPAGIILTKIDNTTVRVSGTPTETGTFPNLSIRANDGTDFFDIANFSITSNPPPNQAPTFSGSTPSIPNLKAQNAMTAFNVIGFNDAEGDSLTFSQIGTWPTGIILTKIDDTTVQISGTPTSAGTFSNLSIRADDGTDTLDIPNFSITVQDGCNGSPSVGTLCADGSVYVGISPDGNVKMYVQRCDAGQIFNSSSGNCECDAATIFENGVNVNAAGNDPAPDNDCDGTADRSNFTWNSGSSNFTTTGITNATTGESNTEALAAGNDGISIDAGGTAGNDRHEAAEYCADLNQHGKTDWYLPAENEVFVIFAARNSGVLSGTFDQTNLEPASRYWSSTEYDVDDARGIRFNDMASGREDKNRGTTVRCARR